MLVRAVCGAPGTAPGTRRRSPTARRRTPPPRPAPPVGSRPGTCRASARCPTAPPTPASSHAALARQRAPGPGRPDGRTAPARPGRVQWRTGRSERSDHLKGTQQSRFNTLSGRLRSPSGVDQVARAAEDSSVVIGGVPVEPGQQIVQVGGGELPLERLCRGVVAVFEGSEPVSDLVKVGEVVGCDDLALDDRRSRSRSGSSRRRGPGCGP